ncbi:hypothetical protein TWF225_005164 [Orbilia oligospora]|uniref:Ecp2 effector protein-like domain-containing protein n=1 Tax=Orbilia oligospora TaxID=2813651 RepID=A0A7C8JA68_ORBOL|nr:hypothetical protein TWF103_000671 [Orbilia oligospora]KAF3105470.1 hypothetical protein TWF102_002381 [Orbilia oligospora]KAF3128722.1 hypothetical protein TWF594_011475 [Orbilia oligospora]KAF3155095.1 hypothetical protein TWF751_003320 [Orbilia oligospora]KAF3185373.1 hypothetical protein TWF225_005164 [Orbilia oligospora]
MRFFTTLIATSVVMTGVLAVPSANTDDAPVSIDSSHLIPQNFTASDGNTYEIWVDAGFLDGEDEDEDDDETDLEKRQTKPENVGRYAPKWKKRSTNQDKCRHSSFVGDTGPHAPTTGRCMAIQEWARTNKGYWAIGWKSITPGKYRALLSSRKSGTTQCLFGVYHNAWQVRIGNSDIYDLIRDSLAKYKRSYNGVWRVRSWGSADCDGDLVQNGSAELKWWMTEKF